jgi:Purple acid Phosphatase, N-terminal domain
VNTTAMKLAITAVLGGLLASTPAVAQQVLPPAPKAAQVQILQGPSLEVAHNDGAIITWTTNNPGGTDSHYGIVKYGTSAGSLSQTATSPMRLNRGHAQTVFRVAVTGLQPRTTYYYTVTSTESDGTSDGVTSSVSQFTTAASGG